MRFRTPLYWSDGTEDQINVCNLDGESCKPVVYDRLKIKRMSFLQIDSLNARLYFDNQDTRINSSPRRIIESVSLDGTDRKMLIGKVFKFLGLFQILYCSLSIL